MPTETNSQGPADTDADTSGECRAGWGVFLDLTKPRLAFLSTLTGLAGYLAAPDNFQWLPFLAIGVSIFLSAAGALALNQVIERNVDGKMDRTKDRPLPAGLIATRSASIFGIITAAIGCGIAFLFLPLSAASLILATVLIYVLLYTPMKRRTHWCTHIGAIPGALPPLIGWSAATGHIGGLGIWLFLILVLWQMPHFFAIAWLCREDYARGGLQMLSVTRPKGSRLVFENFLYLGLLFPVCLAPVFRGEAGWIYGASSLLLNGIFLFEGIRFAKTVRTGGSTGNRLFLFSLLYLPLLLIVLLFDRTYS
ncbi:heme o synthase [Puniceicoccus vermicola]|uniref:Protoheme IX farnesyltransferase n=1 Tax=Puniceicoccus vermicola TaxID=388746 RepID=A0A7X1E3I9_9BACT|nr:heme o synthase [Puniceicoccus vermicola]MBC2601535.1 protoheme IX farnesyltransferase [Puniceicoccus vermicola]